MGGRVGAGCGAAMAAVSALLCCGFVLVARAAAPEFQPSFLVASGPEVNFFLVGVNSSGVKLGVETVAATDDLLQSTCVKTNGTGQWALTSSVDELDVSTLNLQLTLDRPLVLCEKTLNETNCCWEPLCVLETLRVTACLKGNVLATLLVQVIIYVNSTFQGIINENNMPIPKQKYHPLGPCPCNLTARACDVGCCCDKECTADMIQLFHSHCFTGVFGGQVSPLYDHLCSMQNLHTAPEWFPFLCVQSSLKNSPYLGLFFEGDTVDVSQDLSFGVAKSAAVNVPVGYHQGDPIVRGDDELFIIPQTSLNGQCLTNAPVDYLQDFDARCVIPLTAEACADTIGVGEQIQNGLGTLIQPVVTYQTAADLGDFIPITASTSGSLFPKQQNAMASLELVDKSEPKLLRGMCRNMILQADYVFYWNGTTISNINLLVTVGNISLQSSATLTQRFSVTFMNPVKEHPSSVTLSGNPGYLTGKPVLAAIASDKTLIRVPLKIWRPVGNGLCSSAQTTALLFGEDSTSGCLLHLSINDFNNCALLGHTVYENLLKLVPADYIARRGNSNLTDLSEWVPLFKALLNDEHEFSDIEDEFYGYCASIPAAMNIRFFTAVIGAVEAVPQRVILGAEVNFSTVHWKMSCGGGSTATCMTGSALQPFSISAAVQFIQIPAQPEPVQSSFQINHREYECSGNDVCWSELCYPLTRYYTGEPYSESIAQGLLLVFIALLIAVLGSPWSSIRKAWNDTTF